jgi:hypothetical protein
MRRVIGGAMAAAIAILGLAGCTTNSDNVKQRCEQRTDITRTLELQDGTWHPTGNSSDMLEIKVENGSAKWSTVNATVAACSAQVTLMSGAVLPAYIITKSQGKFELPAEAKVITLRGVYTGEFDNISGQ